MMINKGGYVLIKVIPFVAIVIGLKLLAHYLNFEFLSINAIFTGIIGANVFLLGFLLSGVISDFKESEKIPGEMASTLYTIMDELEAAYNKEKKPEVRELILRFAGLTHLIKSWFFKQSKTRELMSELKGIYQDFNKLDGIILPNYIVRIKQEHNSIRKIIIRIHTIRETDFIASGYLIAMTTTALLMTGLIFIKIEPFYESLFFVGLISYLMIFVITLIKDLDNPFGYYEKSSSEDVSLKPIDDLITDLAERIERIF